VNRGDSRLRLTEKSQRDGARTLVRSNADNTTAPVPTCVSDNRNLLRTKARLGGTRVGTIEMRPRIPGKTGLVVF